MVFCLGRSPNYLLHFGAILDEIGRFVCSQLDFVNYPKKKNKLSKGAFNRVSLKSGKQFEIAELREQRHFSLIDNDKITKEYIYHATKNYFEAKIIIE